MHLDTELKYYIPILLQDIYISFRRMFTSAIGQKSFQLNSILGLSMDFLHISEIKTAKDITERRIKDIDFQHSTENAQKICSTIYFGLNFEFG